MAKQQELRQRLDTAIHVVDQRPRKIAPSAPISPLTLTQKMGFKPVVHCACGDSIDLNHAKRREVRAWVDEHEGHLPKEAGEP